MEISAFGENKQTKYNHVAPIDLDTIPQNELEQALLEFAEGSKGLESCLRTMWSNNLKTFACCAGNDHEYEIGNIVMSENVDIFSFLSPELLETDMIALEINDDKQAIYIGGDQKTKENIMHQISYDITQGRKNNKDLLQEKIGKPLNEEWVKAGRINSMRRAGLSEEEIEQEERRLEIYKILEEGTEEEIDAVMPEFTEIVGRLNQRLVEKNTSSRKK